MRLPRFFAALKKSRNDESGEFYKIQPTYKAKIAATSAKITSAFIAQETMKF